jgi:hypothetical protein
MYGKLKSGRPFLADWWRRCKVCGAYAGDTTIAHGTLCGDTHKPERVGRRKLHASVAARLTRPDKDGNPRWNDGTFVAPSKEEEAEIRERLKR